MLKKIIIMVLSFILFFNTWAFANEEISVSSKAAILIEANTGRVLFAKNETEQLSMASTTKIMTALLAAESGRIHEEHIMTSEMVSVEGTSMGLLVGDTVSIEDLIYGMLLQSGNDAANATAIILAGSIEKFAVMMNERAKQIGMVNTNFVTPSGLDDEFHYTTAFDMSLLAMVAIKNPIFANICSLQSAKIEYGNPEYQRTLTNHNKLLKMYDGTFGIKTGYTKKSGRCLVSAVSQNGVNLIVVTLNDSDDWNTHMKLFDYGFDNLSCVNLINENDIFEVDVVGSNTNNIDVGFAYTPTASLKNDDLKDVECEIILYKFIYAPIDINQVVGQATFYYNNIKLCDVPLVAKNSVYAKSINEVKKMNIIEKIIAFFQ